MKEEKFEQLCNSLDTDAAMDQRITDQLMNYESSAANVKRLNWPTYLSSACINNKLFSGLTKIAAIVILITIVGTTTVLAAGYFLKSYQAKFGDIIAEDELPLPQDREITQFGEGHINQSCSYYDPQGNLISASKPGDPNKDDIKYAEEVFAALELPNLIPSYLFDHYLLEEGGYKLIKQNNSDGSVFTHIAAGFYEVDSSKYIYIDYSPSEASVKDTTIRFADEHPDKKTIDYSSYTTESGLLCNLTEDKSIENITAIILYDSESIGNASYMISFTHVPIEEVEAILESIPIDTAAK